MNNKEEKVFIRFTDAPECYDYSNTETVEQIGTMTRGIGRGNPIRKIKITSENSLRFQEPRYHSGLHMCMTLEELEESHDLFGKVNLEAARK